MSERITRINDCKIELGRCEYEELQAMAELKAEQILKDERELAEILTELEIRRGRAIMGEDAA